MLVVIESFSTFIILFILFSTRKMPNLRYIPAKLLDSGTVGYKLRPCTLTPKKRVISTFEHMQ